VPNREMSVLAGHTGAERTPEPPAETASWASVPE
jgi:hypothetical protein